MKRGSQPSRCKIQKIQGFMTGESTMVGHCYSTASSQARTRSILRRGPRNKAKRSITWASTLFAFQESPTPRESECFATPERHAGISYAGSPYPNQAQPMHGSLPSPRYGQGVSSPMSVQQMQAFNVQNQQTNSVSTGRQGARRLNYSSALTDSQAINAAPQMMMGQHHQEQQQHHNHHQGHSQQGYSHSAASPMQSAAHMRPQTPTMMGTPTMMPTPHNLFAGKRTPLAPISPNVREDQANAKQQASSPVGHNIAHSITSPTGPRSMQTQGRFFISDEILC